MFGIPVPLYTAKKVLQERGKDGKDLERFCPRCHRDNARLGLIAKVTHAFVEIVLCCRFKDCGHEWGVQHPLQY